MTARDDTAGLRRTLAILHRLADLGVVEQVLGADGFIRWKAKGSKRRFDAIKKALKINDSRDRRKP